MVWIAALALAAMDAQLMPRNKLSCDLASFIGGGSSSEGNLDSLDGLNLGCNVVLYDQGTWTIGPRVEFAEQRWSVFKTNNDATTLISYQARTVGLGLYGDYSLSKVWRLGYTFNFGMGQGSQQQNLSTATSSLNLRYSAMAQRDFRHEFTVSRQVNSRLALLAGLQFNSAQQSWDANAGTLAQENVAAGNKLTLTSGTSSELEQSLKQSSSYQVISIKLGVQMNFDASPLP